MASFPRADSVVDPILEAAKALRNKRVPLTLDYAFHLVDIAMLQEGPDYVYKNHDGKCFNYDWDEDTESEKGDCLIGRVFEFFVDFNDAERRGTRSSGAFMANIHYGEVFTGTAVDFLSAVQTRQDKGMPWGRAIDFAKAEYLSELEDQE